MDLPAWLTPLPDAGEQRALDTWAIETARDPRCDADGARRHRPGADLRPSAIPTGGIAIVCGKGNNGGDGHVAARVLRELGRDVDRVRASPRMSAELSPAALAGAAGIVDALLGTGFSGAPREPIAGAIAAINAARVEAPGIQVIACDIPSGVDGSTGEVAVRP